MLKTLVTPPKAPQYCWFSRTSSVPRDTQAMLAHQAILVIIAKLQDAMVHCEHTYEEAQDLEHIFLPRAVALQYAFYIKDAGFIERVPPTNIDEVEDRHERLIMGSDFNRPWQ